MRNLKPFLLREPAAVGTLVASILPLLVLFDVLSLSEAQIAALVVFVNALVGFGVRLSVTPQPAPARPRRRRRSAAQRLAS
jgi:hypothetical protein